MMESLKLILPIIEIQQELLKTHYGNGRCYKKEFPNWLNQMKEKNKVIYDIFEKLKEEYNIKKNIV